MIGQRSMLFTVMEASTQELVRNQFPIKTNSYISEDIITQCKFFTFWTNILTFIMEILS